MKETSDWSGLLAYRAPLTVVLRNRWLGIIRLVGIVIVLGYFIVEQMYIKWRYLDLYPLVGAVDIKQGESPAFSRKAFSELPYCEEFLGNPPSDRRYAQKPCVNMPIRDTTLGFDSKKAFFPLRMTDKYMIGLDCMQTVAYTNGEVTCKQKLNASSPDYHYVANIEAAFMYVRSAAIRSAENRHGGSLEDVVFSAEFDDRVMHCRSGATHNVRVEKVTPGNMEYDTFTVGELLECAGIDLDHMSGDGVYAYRFTGVELLMEVKYRYGRSGKVVGCDYYVTPFPMSSVRTHFVPVSASDVSHPGSGYIFEARGGLNINVEIKGFEGEFASDALLISWVSTMALMGLVPFVIDFLMRKVLPLRRLYVEYLDRYSVDFSAFKHGELEAVQAANTLARTNALLKGTRFAWEFSHGTADKVKSYERKLAVVNPPEVQLLLHHARLEKLELAVGEYFREQGFKVYAGDVNADFDDMFGQNETAREYEHQKLAADTTPGVSKYQTKDVIELKDSSASLQTDAAGQDRPYTLQALQNKVFALQAEVMVLGAWKKNTQAQPQKRHEEYDHLSMYDQKRILAEEKYEYKAEIRQLIEARFAGLQQYMDDRFTELERGLYSKNEVQRVEKHLAELEQSFDFKKDLASVKAGRRSADATDKSTTERLGTKRDGEQISINSILGRLDARTDLLQSEVDAINGRKTLDTRHNSSQQAASCKTEQKSHEQLHPAAEVSERLTVLENKQHNFDVIMRRMREEVGSFDWKIECLEQNMAISLKNNALDKAMPDSVISDQDGVKPKEVI